MRIVGGESGPKASTETRKYVIVASKFVDPKKKYRKT